MLSTKVRKLVTATLCVSVVTVAALFGGTAGASKGADAEAKPPPPTTPPFLVDNAGRIIPGSVPDKVGVRGVNGKPAGELTREEFVALLNPPNLPPDELPNRRRNSLGPQPDRTVLTQQSASGDVVTTVEDHSTGRVTQTRTTPDGEQTTMDTR